MCGELWLVEGWWWDTPSPTTTPHMGELWLFLCHLLWHKTYPWNNCMDDVACYKVNMVHEFGFIFRAIPRDLKSQP